MIKSLLIFSRSTPHHRTGGMETVAWSLAAQWARSVPEVRLVTTGIPAAPGPFTEDGVHVVPLAGTRPGDYSAAWWGGSRDYWTSLDTPPDVVLSVSAGAYAVVRERARHSRTPFVMQAHGTAVMEIGSKLRAHDLRSLATTPKNMLGLVRDIARYRDFDRIVAVGGKVAESLAASPNRWSVPAGRVNLIPNGVRAEDHGFDPRSRAEIRARLGIGDATSVVACVGRLHVQKRMDRALRAAAVLRDRGADFVFLVVGDGPDEGRLRGVVRELRLADVVRFAGRVRPGDVRGYHAAADLALITTARLEVGLAMVGLEALASGLPCIVPAGSSGSAVLDRVLHEVDPGDPARLADVVGAVARVRRPRMSLLPAEFTLEHSADHYLTTFADLASAARP
jgi:glycosyltransferase involved in cell wall biosynthesis